MSLAVILLVVSVLLVLIGAGFYVKRRIDGAYNDVQGVIDGLFSSQDADTPSLVNQTIDSVAKAVCDRLQTAMEARLMATKSHEAKAENLMAEDIVADLATGASPLLGVALEALPHLRKRLAKNPTALSVLLPLVQGVFKGGHAGNHADQSQTSSVAARIKGGV